MAYWQQLSAKFKPLFFYVFLNLVLLPASISLHEWGHWFSFYCLGHKQGYVIFSLAGGMFISQESIADLSHLFIIGISGGMTVTFIFGILYLCLDWETDYIEKQVLRNYIAHQFFYAFAEAFYAIGLYDINVLSAISMFIYPICLYGTLIYICIQLFKGDCDG